MKKYFFLLITLLTTLAAASKAQTIYFPPLTGDQWDTVSAQSLGWNTDKIDSLYSYLARMNTKAFILLKNGTIVLEHYFGTFTKDSNFYWASAGKTLTALTVGIAKQENLLALDDRTSKYLDTGWTICPRPKEDLILIRHQLTMTSGLDDKVADPFCTNDTSLKYIADAGTRWAYHNAPYTLLDKVIEKATGQTMNQYVSTKIRSKTGMNGAFIPVGYNNVYFSTGRSMARFGLLILNKGVWDKTAVISDTAYFRQMTTTSQDLNKSYGYLWWLNGKASFMVPTLQTVFPGSWAPDGPADMIAALGKNGQLLNVAPGMGIVFIRMGNAPDSGEIPFTLNNQIWQRLNTIMGTTDITHAPSSGSDVHGLVLTQKKGRIHLTLSERVSKAVFVRIVDLSGRVLFQKSFTENTRIAIPTNSFTPGIYILYFTKNNSIINKRFIVSGR